MAVTDTHMMPADKPQRTFKFKTTSGAVRQFTPGGEWSTYDVGIVAPVMLKALELQNCVVGALCYNARAIILPAKTHGAAPCYNITREALRCYTDLLLETHGAAPCYNITREALRCYISAVTVVRIALAG
jgi:hypothetical protein